MSVEFEESDLSPRQSPVKKSNGLTALFIAWGLAKDEAAANKLMIAISIGAIILAVALPFLF